MANRDQTSNDYKVNGFSSNGASSSHADSASSISAAETHGTPGSTEEGRNFSSLDAALAYLERAITDNKEEFEQRLSSNFKSLKRALGSLIPEVGRLGSETLNSARALGRQGFRRSRKMAEQVDHQARENPWTYLAAVAGASLLLGFFLGRSSVAESEH